VGTRSREENASKQQSEKPGSDSIGTGKSLVRDSENKEK
jgi:hypothetical protein